MVPARAAEKAMPRERKPGTSLHPESSRLSRRRRNLIAPVRRLLERAYGWEPEIGDEELLEKLLALNLAQAGA